MKAVWTPVTDHQAAEQVYDEYLATKKRCGAGGCEMCERRLRYLIANALRHARMQGALFGQPPSADAVDPYDG